MSVTERLTAIATGLTPFLVILAGLVLSARGHKRAGLGLGVLGFGLYVALMVGLAVMHGVRICV